MAASPLLFLLLCFLPYGVLNINIFLDILHILVFIIVIIITTSIVIVGVDSGYYERMLLRDLMENYQKLERPVSRFFLFNLWFQKLSP